MSSFDRARPKPRRQAVRAVLFALAAGFLAACTVQPVYGPAMGGGAVSSALRGVSIDPVSDRVGQVVRNKLVANFAGPGATDPAYHLHLTVSTSETALGIGAAGASPTNSVTVVVTYELTKVGTSEVVDRRNARASASYDLTNQAFANVRAKIDAENRAAATVAGEVQIRVAAALAARA